MSIRVTCTRSHLREEQGSGFQHPKAHSVSGMLLYAKTDEEIQPDGVYQMSGNQISVRTDLNQPFEEIRSQLDGLLRHIFKGGSLCLKD